MAASSTGYQGGHRTEQEPGFGARLRVSQFQSDCSCMDSLTSLHHSIHIWKRGIIIIPMTTTKRNQLARVTLSGQCLAYRKGSANVGYDDGG